ncbi:MAG: hypothetical protein IKR48_08970 [Kiritimatiellae bacterium]|nr:hypothetical protein [Kiritimatiellia bacterium]
MKIPMTFFVLFSFAVSLSAVELTDIPANCHWLTRLDSRELRNAPMTQTLINQILPQHLKLANGKRTSFSEFLGTDPVNDLDEIVAGGLGNETAPWFVLLSGKWNPAQVRNSLKMARTFVSENHRKYEVMSWRAGNGQTRFVVFPRPGLALVANTRNMAKSNLDALDKLIPTQPVPDIFLPVFKRAPGCALVARCDSTVKLKLQFDIMQMLNPVVALGASVTIQGKDRMDVKFSAKTPSSEQAQVLKQTLAGMQALAMLTAKDHPEEAELLSRAKLKSKNDTVTANFTLDTNTAIRLLQMAQRKGASNYNLRELQQRQRLRR